MLDENEGEDKSDVVPEPSMPVEVPAPVEEEPIQIPAPAEEVPTHPTGFIVPDNEVQEPTGAVTEEGELPADNPEGDVEEEVYELGEQVEPLDEPNGGI